MKHLKAQLAHIGSFLGIFYSIAHTRTRKVKVKPLDAVEMFDSAVDDKYPLRGVLHWANSEGTW